MRYIYIVESDCMQQRKLVRKVRRMVCWFCWGQKGEEEAKGIGGECKNTFLFLYFCVCICMYICIELIKRDTYTHSWTFTMGSLDIQSLDFDTSTSLPQKKLHQTPFIAINYGGYIT